VDAKAEFLDGVTLPDYSTVQALWVWEFRFLAEESGTLKGSGPCPRCGHTITDRTTIGIGSFFAPPNTISATPTIKCDCLSPHKGRPKDKKGCGYEAALNVTATVIRNPMSTPIEEKWGEQAVKLEVGMVESIRASAEKWGASISTLTALVGASTVFGSGEAIAKLSDEAQRWVWAGFAVATVSAVVAVYLAAIAAQGVPKLQTYDAQNVYEASLTKSEQAAGWLWWSRLLIFPAMLGFGVAASFLTFGETKEEAKKPALHIAFFANKDAICGPFSTMPSKTDVGLKVGETVVSIQGAVSVLEVKACSDSK
jgi:hypothetical protein